MEKNFLTGAKENLSPYRMLSLGSPIPQGVDRKPFDLTPEDELARLRKKHQQVLRERDDYNIRMIALQEKWTLEIKRFESKNKLLHRQLEAYRQLFEHRNAEEDANKQTLADQKAINTSLQKENNDISQMLAKLDEDLDRIPDQSLREHIVFPPRGDERPSSSGSPSNELLQMPELYISPPPSTRSSRNLVSSWTAPTRRRRSFREVSKARAVDKTVLDMVKEFEAVGISLPLQKEQDFVYSLYKKRLFLSMREGKLYVGTKRGYQEFLPFLDQLNF